MEIFPGGSGLSPSKEVNKGEIIILTGLRERDKREKSEEKIYCHQQDSNQGPSLVASDALTTELWCSRHPSRGRSTFSSDFVTHKLEGCRLALGRCVEVRCQDVECLSTLSVLCLVIALSDCI